MSFEFQISSFECPPQGVWDVVVIGAGPAGAMAAGELARRGLRVAMLEKASLPRDKVCGCCVNASALADLERAELGDLPAKLGASTLHRLELHAGRRSAELSLHRGAAISRTALDAELAERAIQRGACLFTRCNARVGPCEKEHRVVWVKWGGERGRVRARVVVIAHGLGGRSLEHVSGFETTTRPGSRMGAGAVMPRAPAHIPPGVVHMSCGYGGYVGMVRLENGSLDVAAAFDRQFVKERGGPGPAARAILDQTITPGDRRPQVRIEQLSWRGTPLLTRRPRSIAGERVLLTGDAAGYIEPFTGEGIGWAIRSGAALAPIAADAARKGWSQDHAAQWEAAHRRIVRRRQRVCRLTARALRHPLLTRAAVSMLTFAPRAAGPALRTTWG